MDDVLVGSFPLENICLPSLYSEIIACPCVISLGNILLPPERWGHFLSSSGIDDCCGESQLSDRLSPTPTLWTHPLYLSGKFNSLHRLCSAVGIYHIFLEHHKLIWSEKLFFSSLQGNCLEHFWVHLFHPYLRSRVQEMPVKVVLEHHRLTLISRNSSAVAAIFVFHRPHWDCPLCW